MKITICGSIAFYPEMESLREQLFRLDHDVQIPELALEVPMEYGGGKKIYFEKFIQENGGIDSFSHGHKIWDLKEAGINDHFEKIKWGDSILVANYKKRGISGYIGGNTLIEIGLAFFLKKPIYILNAVSSDLSYKQEILGMKPIMLNRDLGKIP